MAFINLPAISAQNYKSSVATLADLPATGNADGDVRVTRDTSDIYVWNATSSSWVTPSGGGGSGLSNLNGQTGSSQSFSTGTSGSDFNISSSSNIHTFNIPNASTTARGVLSTAAQTIGGDKTFNDDVAINGDFQLARRSESFTLSAGQIAAKSVTLSRTPYTISETKVFIKDGPPQFEGVSNDFTVTGTTLSWNGLGLDGILVTGDLMTVEYN